MEYIHHPSPFGFLILKKIKNAMFQKDNIAQMG